MDAYSSFASTTPGASRAARDQRRRQRKTAAAEEEEEEAVRASLVAKAAAMTKIAENMAAHNEAMLQGIRAQRPASPPPYPRGLAGAQPGECVCQPQPDR
eukprot:SAG25_NODE_7489_length_478_cov_0.781003_1_plen_99_part_10